MLSKSNFKLYVLYKVTDKKIRPFYYYFKLYYLNLPETKIKFYLIFKATLCENRPLVWKTCQKIKQTETFTKSPV